jgi:hypothetical protein
MLEAFFLFVSSAPHSLLYTRGVTTLEPAHLNVAYDELMQWGPRLGQPMLPRLKERLPGLADDLLLELHLEAQRAQGLANELCERAYGHELTREEVQWQLLERFPWIDEGNFSHAFSQGMYFAWHG